MDLGDLLHDNELDKRRCFPCPECHKRFTRKSDLPRHMKTHKGIRDFICKMPDSGDPNIICGKRFGQRSALTVHMRSHTGERPYVCETCGKSFSDSSSAARHRRTHDPAKPYRCEVPGCTKGFKRSSVLREHCKTAHGGLGASYVRMASRSRTKEAKIKSSTSQSSRPRSAAAPSPPPAVGIRLLAESSGLDALGPIHAGMPTTPLQHDTGGYESGFYSSTGSSTSPPHASPLTPPDAAHHLAQGSGSKRTWAWSPTAAGVPQRPSLSPNPEEASFHGSLPHPSYGLAVVHGPVRHSSAPTRPASSAPSQPLHSNEWMPFPNLHGPVPPSYQHPYEQQPAPPPYYQYQFTPPFQQDVYHGRHHG